MTIAGIFQGVASTAETCFSVYQTWARKVLFSSDGEAAASPSILRAALGILFIEPHHMLKIGALMLPGSLREFHWFGLNPKKLTQEQAKTFPLLLLHGRCHNQGVWIPLAKAIQKSGLSNPVYTLNLDSLDSESDVRQIEKKLEEIKSQYEEIGIKNVQIDLLGYSAGGHTAYKMGVKSAHHLYHETPFRFDIPSHISKWYRRDEIGEILLLGEVSSKEEMFTDLSLKKDYESLVFEILASNDFLVPFPSSLPKQRQSKIETTHLGLPFSTDVHKKVIDLMRSRSFMASYLLKTLKMNSFKETIIPDRFE